MNRFVKSLLRVLIAGTFAVGCAAQSQSSNRSTTQSGRDRLQIAEQMFQAHCMTAGEKIYKTVDNVESVFLMKVRPEQTNYHDQYAMDDPYGRDFGEEAYIKSFLRGFFEANYRIGKSPLSTGPRHIAYRSVDAIDPKDGKRYRYIGAVKAVGTMDTSAPNIQLALKSNPKFDVNIYAFVVDRVPTSDRMPRYGVTYDDISTQDDREYWMAGSSLKVIDLQTNEIIAERIGYMMDPRQGDTSGGRAPWLLAADHACPAFATLHGSAGQPLQTEIFVEKVLKPISDKK